jgi:thioredoxin reductase (NADPH)
MVAPMEKPVLLSVDDDADVLRAVERDLRRRYADRFRVLSAGSGAEALDLLRRVVLRGEEVALLLVDQRMPEMTGVEFLAAARDIAPSAKRVLLTAYADTEVAIRAINEVHLDHYLMKPWHPPEERLYPVLDDLLGDWQASALAGAEAVRVIGHRWSADSHRIRDFMTRNQVAHRWLDAEHEAGRQLLAAAAPEGDERLPLLIFPDGSTLVAPGTAELAERVGLRTRAELPFYDLVIVGGGPAGLAAAVYGASEGLRTVLLEAEASGGQAGQSSRIENYLGFPSGLSGSDLARRAIAQATRFGAELLTAAEVSAIEAKGPSRVVRCADGRELGCHAILIATGVAYRRLEAEGAERLTGRGVYYGAALGEAAFFDGMPVVVVGGANSAGQAALHLALKARVTMVVRGGSLDRWMSSYLVERILPDPTINVCLNAEVVAVHGEEKVEGVTIEEAGTRSVLETDGVFVFIGAEPHTAWLHGLVACSEGGFVLSGPQVTQRDGGDWARWPLERDPYLLETNIPGIFVAGDVREQSIKRVASAVGEGAMAVSFIHQYLREL